MPKLGVLIASTRPGRVGLPTGLWAEQMAIAHAGFDVTLIDLLEVGLPFVDEPNHPRLRQYEHEHTRQWSATINEIDAFVFVTPEYNYGMAATLKNAIDFLNNEWKYKALGFVSYGGISAGTRGVQMAKQVVTTVGLVPVACAVQIPFIKQFIDENGELEANEVMEKSMNSMLDELLQMDAALSVLRDDQQQEQG